MSEELIVLRHAGCAVGSAAPSAVTGVESAGAGVRVRLVRRRASSRRRRSRDWPSGGRPAPLAAAVRRRLPVAASRPGALRRFPGRWWSRAARRRAAGAPWPGRRGLPCLTRHALRTTMPTAPALLALLAVGAVISPRRARELLARRARRSSSARSGRCRPAGDPPQLRLADGEAGRPGPARHRRSTSSPPPTWCGPGDRGRAAARARGPAGRGPGAARSARPRIQRSSVEVAGAAGAVKRIASELAAGSSEQSASVVEITAAMEELAQTASQIAGNAEAQAELARLEEVRGNEGAAAVGRAVAGVERLRERIAAIARRADRSRAARRGDLRGARAGRGHRARDPPPVAQRRHRSGGRERRGRTPLRRGRRGGPAAFRPLARGRRFGPPPARGVLGLDRATAERRRRRARSRAGAAAHDRDTAARSPACTRPRRDGRRRARDLGGLGRSSAPPRLEVVQTLREASRVVQQIAESLRGFSGAARGLEEAAVSVQLLAQGFRLDSPRRCGTWRRAGPTELRPLARQPRGARTPARVAARAAAGRRAAPSSTIRRRQRSGDRRPARRWSAPSRCRTRSGSAATSPIAPGSAPRPPSGAASSPRS